jgi:hypothetical protein
VIAMQKTYPIMNGTEPAIVQTCVNGWPVSWNPDDGAPGIAVASFKDRRNALQYARCHEPPVEPDQGRA